MKTARVIFAFLLIVPLALGLYYLFNPGSYWPDKSTTGEMFFLIFGLPVLLLNYFAWFEPRPIEEMFFTRKSADAVNQEHILCTYCSAEKDKAEGLLPANKRYISERISKIEEMAEQSNLRLCILSGEFGLLESNQPIPWYDHLLLPDEVPALVEKVTAQLVEKGIKEVDYYTQSVEADPNTAPYTSTIETACAKAGAAFNRHVVE